MTIDRYITYICKIYVRKCIPYSAMSLIRSLPFFSPSVEQISTPSAWGKPSGILGGREIVVSKSSRAITQKKVKAARVQRMEDLMWIFHFNQHGWYADMRFFLRVSKVNLIETSIPLALGVSGNVRPRHRFSVWWNMTPFPKKCLEAAIKSWESKVPPPINKALLRDY